MTRSKRAIAWVSLPPCMLSEVHATNSYGRFVFQADGTICGYSNPNESRWKLENGILTFFNEVGTPTSRFSCDGGLGCWAGSPIQSKWPLVLVPLLRHCRAEAMESSTPPVLINSIPKSGTYYMEAAFAALNWHPTRLHLGSDGVVDDYRGLPDELVHSRPDQSRLYCPIECLAAILKPGDVVVGHIDSVAEVDYLRTHGLFDVSLVRDLRNVIVSMYNFKLRKIAPTNLGDESWRCVAGAERFSAYF